MLPLAAYDHPRRRVIVAWIFTLAAMAAAMVLIGGLTRLTESGLSIVVWQPITGAIPPLSDRAWDEAFRLYQQSPEYQMLNYGMALPEFKRIFWVEFVHRLWGRLIGVGFLIPFLVFLVRGAFRGDTGRALLTRLLGVFALGGVQAVIGWLMVASGLVDRPEVSAYRLALHFAVGVLIFLSLLTIGLKLLHRPLPTPDEAAAAHDMRRRAGALLVLAYVTAIAGSFVAGLKAGLTYNTFPLMDGRLVPDGYLMLEPWWRNLFENVAAVQFDHRVLGMVTALAGIAVWLTAMRRPLPRKARVALHHVGGMALVQPTLGILTLINVVPIPLALAHQAGALALLASIQWYRIEMERTRIVLDLTANS
ncbi:MAG: COX15/CtaA family protein [Gemmatimonas sp.]